MKPFNVIKWKFFQYPFQLIVPFFSFSIVVKDGYGKNLLYSYCDLGERAFLNTSTLNISVEVRAYSKYNTFTARYAILNGSIYKGKEFGLSCFRSVCVKRITKTENFKQLPKSFCLSSVDCHSGV